MAGQFSFPTVTHEDLKDKTLFRLNRLFQLLAEQISKTQGAQGPVVFDIGPFTFRGTVTFGDQVSASALQTFPNNAAASAAGLPPGALYRTATGFLMVVF